MEKRAFAPWWVIVLTVPVLLRTAEREREKPGGTKLCFDFISSLERMLSGVNEGVVIV